MPHCKVNSRIYFHINALLCILCVLTEFLTGPPTGKHTWNGFFHWSNARQFWMAFNFILNYSETHCQLLNLHWHFLCNQAPSSEMPTYRAQIFFMPSDFYLCMLCEATSKENVAEKACLFLLACSPCLLQCRVCHVSLNHCWKLFEWRVTAAKKCAHAIIHPSVVGLEYLVEEVIVTSRTAVCYLCNSSAVILNVRSLFCVLQHLMQHLMPEPLVTEVKNCLTQFSI